MEEILLIKKIYSFFIGFMLFMLVLSQLPQSAEAAIEIPLTNSLLTSYSKYEVYFDKWDSKTQFENTDGEIVSSGIGFEPDYSNTSVMYAIFDVKDYNFTTFESKISLDKKWIVGDRGKTQVVVYADDNKLYEQQFSNLTSVQNLKLAVPDNTGNIKLFVVMDEGSQGNHRMIFENPRLTNSLPQKDEIDSLALTSIGASNYSKYEYYVNNWSSIPFENSRGNLYARGIGFEPDYSNTSRMYAQYYIKDYDYTTLQTQISLDNKWRSGDRGKSEVLIYADDTKIYSTTFTNTTDVKDVKIAIPKDTEYITFYALVERGSQGNHAIVIENPLLTRELPQSPKSDIESLIKNGAAEYSKYETYTNFWNGSPFHMSEGNLIARGVGFEPDYSNTKRMSAKYYIGDYNYDTLKANVSLDKKWSSGDRGSSSVSIYADDSLLYKKDFINSSKTDILTLNIPKGTTYVTFVVDIVRGTGGNHGVIIDDPILLNSNSIINVTDVSIIANSNKIKVGDKLQFTANVIPSNATNKNVSWTSSNSSILMVNQNGLATAIAPGDSIITVTTADGNYTDSVRITVESKSNQDPPSEGDFKVWEPKFNVPVKKPWNVEFSLPVDIATILEKNIYVTDSKGNIFPMLYIVAHNKVTLGPARDYEKGETYTLWIKDIKGTNGKVIKENIKMQFTIEGENEVIDIQGAINN